MTPSDKRCATFTTLIMIKPHYLFNVIEKKKLFYNLSGFFFLLPMMLECSVPLVEKLPERLVKSNDKVIHMVDFMGWHSYITIQNNITIP